MAASRPASMVAAVRGGAAPAGLALVDTSAPPKASHSATTTGWALTRTATPSWAPRSEEHTSELQPLMRISYAAVCLNKNHTESYSETIQLRNDKCEE